jgi:hypothetical protein
MFFKVSVALGSLGVSLAAQLDAVQSTSQNAMPFPQWSRLLNSDWDNSGEISKDEAFDFFCGMYDITVSGGGGKGKGGGGGGGQPARSGDYRAPRKVDPRLQAELKKQEKKKKGGRGLRRLLQASGIGGAGGDAGFPHLWNHRYVALANLAGNDGSVTQGDWETIEEEAACSGGQNPQDCNMNLVQYITDRRRADTKTAYRRILQEDLVY